MVDGVSKNVKMFMKGASEELKKMQDTPIGREPRSKQELTKIFETLMAMPRDQRGAKMEELATMYGHKGSKPDNCELCQFLTKIAQNKGYK